MSKTFNSERGTAKGRRLVVTGYDSFLGRKISSALAERGALVRVIVPRAELTTDAQENGCQAWVGDMGIPESLTDALIGFTGLIHVETAKTRGDDKFANLIDAAEAQGVRRLVYVDPLGTTHSDGSQKKAPVERSSKYDIPLVHLRTSLVISRNSPLVRMIGRHTVFGRVLWPGDLDAEVSPVSLEDLIRVLVRVCDVGSELEGEFEACGPEKLTMREVIEKASGSGDELRVHEVPRFISNVIDFFSVSHDEVLRLLDRDLACSGEAIWPHLGIAPSSIEEAS